MSLWGLSLCSTNVCDLQTISTFRCFIIKKSPGLKNFFHKIHELFVIFVLQCIGFTKKKMFTNEKEDGREVPWKPSIFNLLTVCLVLCLHSLNINLLNRSGTYFFMAIHMTRERFMDCRLNNLDNGYFGKCANLNKTIRQHFRIIKNFRFQSHSWKLKGKDVQHALKV